MRQKSGPYFRKKTFPSFSNKVLPLLMCMLIGLCFTPSAAAFAYEGSGHQTGGAGLQAAKAGEQQNDESKGLQGAKAGKQQNDESKGLQGAKGDGLQNGKIDNPYMRVSFSDLLSDKALSLSEGMDNTAITELPGGSGADGDGGDANVGGAKVRGTVSDLTSGRVIIGEDFVFDGNPVGRISLLAGTDMGLIVKARVYLDDETEPVAVFRLDNGKASSGWDEIDEYTCSVYDKKIKGTHKVSLGFDVTGKDPEDKINVALKRIEFAEDPGIPTLYFNIDENETTIEDMNNSPDHSVRCTGSFDIQVPDGFVNEYGGTITSEKDIKLGYIRGRGHSTWPDKEKKPYKIKLDKSKDLFNMGKNANYVLLANRYDGSLSRERMTHWLSAKMGVPYTPQSVPVDMVMNGEYLGTYLLAEEVRIGKARIAIDELKAEDTTLPDISGGYLLRMNPYDPDRDPNVFVTENKVRFQNEDPDFIDYENDAQKEYIRSFVQKTEDAILGEDFKDSDGNSYTKYMDLNSLVNFWWVQEFSMNRDAYKTNSNYLYKPRGEDEKLYWGPLWDFDLVAWGDLESPDEMRTEGLSNTGFIWTDRLLADPAFNELLKARWPEINGYITEIIKKGGLLDKYYEQLLISERYDVEKLGFYSGFGDTIPPGHSFKDEMDQLKTWISKRQAWVNDHKDEVTNLTQEVTFYLDGAEYAKRIVKGKIKTASVDEPPEKEGYVFDAWYTKPSGGDRVDGEYDIDKDTALYARYVKKEKADMVKELCFITREQWVDISEDEFSLEFVALPQDALIRNLRWSSSDESTATVTYDDSVYVDLLKTGTVTITGTMPGGNSSSVILHIYDPAETQQVDLEGIQMEKDEITIEQGQSTKNWYKLLPADKPVKYPAIRIAADKPDIVKTGYLGVVTGLKPGTATVTITDDRSGLSASYKVIVKKPASEKKTNPMTVKGKTVKVKHANVKKKAFKIKRTRAFAIKKAKGTVTYTRIAKGSSRRLAVNKKTGVITVKKGTKKGLYKVKVKVRAAGNKTYKAKVKTVTVKVRVR